MLTCRVLSPIRYLGCDRAVGEKVGLPRDLAAYLQACGSVEVPGTPEAVAKTNLNTAPLALLVALPGVGKAKAAAIKSSRPIESLSQAQAAARLSDAAWAVVTPLVEL